MPESNQDWVAATALRWSIGKLKSDGSLSQEHHDKLMQLSKKVGSSLTKLIEENALLTEENQALRGIVRSAAAVLQEAQ